MFAKRHMLRGKPQLIFDVAHLAPKGRNFLRFLTDYPNET